VKSSIALDDRSNGMLVGQCLHGGLLARALLQVKSRDKKNKQLGHKATPAKNASLHTVAAFFHSSMKLLRSPMDIRSRRI
jgi:hypothetical protein